jgi:hypothetical protein
VNYGLIIGEFRVLHKGDSLLEKMKIDSGIWYTDTEKKTFSTAHDDLVPRLWLIFQKTKELFILEIPYHLVILQKVQYLVAYEQG